MDSLSQFVLGASVAVAAMGPRTAAWKAALWGGVAAGTLPDLDVFVDHGDALSNMVLHRAESHSLFWLTLASPALAACPARWHGQDQFRRWWLAMWLALATHPLLDAMTVYGTQLLLPFTTYPFGVGSIFIIDPLYTLPLLAGVVVAATRRRGHGLAWVHGGLVLSSAYLAWSMAAQWHVRTVAQSSLATVPPPAALLVTPTPFNTMLWRVVAMYPDGSYQEGFRSLADGDRPMRWQRFDAPSVPAAVRALPAVQRLAAFSHGFYKVHTHDGQGWVTDLRMGQEPHYSFSFVVADQQGGTWRPVSPRNQGSRGDVQSGLAWTWQRMWGWDVPPPRAGAR